MLALDFPPERVKTIRVQLGMSQGDFAKKVGVDPGMVSRWETGNASPRQGRVLKALLDAEREIDG